MVLSRRLRLQCQAIQICTMMLFHKTTFYNWNFTGILLIKSYLPLHYKLVFLGEQDNLFSKTILHGFATENVYCISSYKPSIENNNSSLYYSKVHWTILPRNYRFWIQNNLCGKYSFSRVQSGQGWWHTRIHFIVANQENNRREMGKIVNLLSIL